MRSKSFFLPLILLCLILLLSACRVRTTGELQQTETETDGSSTRAEDALAGNSPADEAPSETSAEAEDAREAEGAEAGSRTRENPESARREYDENAPAEIVPGTEHELNGEGEGSGAPVRDEDSENSAVRLDDQAEETATETVAAEQAEQMGVDPDAEAADSALTYYTVLLSDRMGAVFECQRANVYWETEQDHVTVFKTSPEHALILNAGAYDVSARLLEENLRVDDGWVARKNPGVIVKVVDGSVLGGGAVTTNAAQAVLQDLLSREGWRDIEAVRSGRVLLLSEELLEAPYLQVAAMLMLARTSNPDALQDVDLDEALQALMEEATGMLPTGIYYYQSGKP